MLPKLVGGVRLLFSLLCDKRPKIKKLDIDISVVISNISFWDLDRIGVKFVNLIPIRTCDVIKTCADRVIMNITRVYVKHMGNATFEKSYLGFLSKIGPQIDRGLFVLFCETAVNVLGETLYHSKGPLTRSIAHCLIKVSSSQKWSANDTINSAQKIY